MAAIYVWNIITKFVNIFYLETVIHGAMKNGNIQHSYVILTCILHLTNVIMPTGFTPFGGKFHVHFTAKLLLYFSTTVFTHFHLHAVLLYPFTVLLKIHRDLLH